MVKLSLTDFTNNKDRDGVIFMAKESAASKAARVKLQLRDKHGQWVEMGGGAKWIDNKSNSPKAGTIVGFDGNFVLVAQKPANATAEPAPMRIPVGAIETYKIKGNLDPYYKSQIDKFLNNLSPKDKKELDAREKAVSEGKKAQLDGKPDLVKDYVEIFDEDDDTDGKFENEKVIKLHEFKTSPYKNIVTEDGVEWYRSKNGAMVELAGEGKTVSSAIPYYAFQNKYTNSPNITVLPESNLPDRLKNFKEFISDLPVGAQITDNKGEVWTKADDGEMGNGKVNTSGKMKPSVLRFNEDLSKVDVSGVEKSSDDSSDSSNASDGVAWPESKPEAGKYKLNDFVSADAVKPGEFVHLNAGGKLLSDKEYADYDQDVSGKIGYITDVKAIKGTNKTSMGKRIGSAVTFIDEDGNTTTQNIFAPSPNNKFGNNGIFTYDSNSSGQDSSSNESDAPVVNEAKAEVSDENTVSPFAKDVPADKDVAPNQILKSGVVLTPLADVAEGEEILGFKYDAEHPPKSPYSLSQIKIDGASDDQFAIDTSLAPVVIGKKTPGKYAAVDLGDGNTAYLGMSTFVIKSSDNSSSGSTLSSDDSATGESPAEALDASATLLKLGVDNFKKEIAKTDSREGLLALIGKASVMFISEHQTFGGSSNAKSEQERAAGAKLIDDILAKVSSKYDEDSAEALNVLGNLAKAGIGNPLPFAANNDFSVLAKELGNPESFAKVLSALESNNLFTKAKAKFMGKDNSDMISSEQLAAFKRHMALARSLNSLDKSYVGKGAEVSSDDIGTPDKKIDPTVPIDVSSWTKISGPQGSNPGGIYEDEKGNRWYVKQSKSDDHAKNEVLADMLYTEAGIDVAGLRLADVGNGKLGTASPMIEGAKNNLGQMFNNKSYVDKIREGFALDAWLANWDVIGLANDNVVTDSNGSPVRVDPGGAMKYRAQGGLKNDLNPKFWSNDVLDWDSLRDPSVGTAAKVFSSITDEQMIASADRVEAITPEMIDEMVSKLNMDSSEADILKARREGIIAKRDALKPAEAVETEVEAPVADESSDAPEAPKNDSSDTPDEVQETPNAESTGKTVYPDKGKVAIGENGEEFKVNMEVVHAKYGPSTITTILPSVNSAKIITSSGETYTVGAKKIKMASADAPIEEVFGAPTATGESGIDPLNGKLFIVAKEGTRVYVGSSISYTKKGESYSGTVTNLYPSSQQVKVTWDDPESGQAPVKKVSQLVATDGDSIQETIAKVEAAPEPTPEPEPIVESASEWFFIGIPTGYTTKDLSTGTTYLKTPMGFLDLGVLSDENNMVVYTSSADMESKALPEANWESGQNTTNLHEEDIDDLPEGTIVYSEKLKIKFEQDSDGDWFEVDSDHNDSDYYSTDFLNEYVVDDWEIDQSNAKVESNISGVDLDDAPQGSEAYSSTHEITFEKDDYGMWTNQNTGSTYDSDDILDSYPASDWHISEPEFDVSDYVYSSDLDEIFEESSAPIGSVVSYSDSYTSSLEYAVKVSGEVWVSSTDESGTIDKYSSVLGKYDGSDAYVKVEKVGLGELDDDNLLYLPDLVGSSDNTVEASTDGLNSAPVGSIIQININSNPNFIKKFEDGWFLTTVMGSKKYKSNLDSDTVLMSLSANEYDSYSPAPAIKEDVVDDSAIKVGQTISGTNASDYSIGSVLSYFSGSGLETTLTKIENDLWKFEMGGVEYNSFKNSDVQALADGGAGETFTVVTVGDGSSDIPEPVAEVGKFAEMFGDYTPDNVADLPIGATFTKPKFAEAGEDVQYMTLKKDTDGVFKYNSYGDNWNTINDPFDYMSIFSDFKLDPTTVGDGKVSVADIEEAVVVTDSPSAPEVDAVDFSGAPPLKVDLKENSVADMKASPIGTSFYKEAIGKTIKKTGADAWKFFYSDDTTNGNVYDTEDMMGSYLSNYKLVEGTAPSFESIEKEKLAGMTNVEKANYFFEDMPKDWGKVKNQDSLPNGVMFVYAPEYLNGQKHTWVKMDTNKWLYTDTDGDTYTKPSNHLSSEYTMDETSWNVAKADAIEEAMLADGLDVPGDDLGSDVPLADMDLASMATGKTGSKIQMSKTNGEVVGDYVKKSADMWFFVPAGQDKKSPTYVTSTDFEGVLGNKQYSFVVNPSPVEVSDGEAEVEVPEVDLFYTKHVPMTTELMQSYPSGTVLKREGQYMSWDDKFYFVKEDDGSWTKFKVNTSKITKTANADYEIYSGYAMKNYAVSIVDQSKNSVVTATGEIAYEGDTVYDVHSKNEYTISKILKTGINAVDENGEKFKLKSKDIGKNIEHTTPSASGNGTSAKVSFENPVSTFAKAKKAKEEAQKIIAEFAGASAAEYNEKGLGVHYAEADFDNGIGVAPKVAVDESNPLYGAPQPIAPTPPSSYPSFKKPSENLPLWDSAEWLKSVEDRYKANPNKAKDTVQESNKWGAIKTVIDGDTDHLDSLLNSKYLDDDMYEKAKNGIAEHKKTLVDLKKEAEANNDKAYTEYLVKKNEYLAEYNEKAEKYKEEIKSWTEANPVQGAIDPIVMPEPSKTAYTGGAITGDEGPIGTLSANGAINGVKEDSTLAAKGISFAVDSDMIEDFDVEVFRLIDDDGVQKLEYNFKMTSAHAPVVEATIQTLDSNSTGDIYLKHKVFDKFTGLLKNTKGIPKANKGGSWAQDGKRYVAKVGKGEVTFQRSSNTSLTDYNISSNHNTVRVTLPVDSDSSDFRDVLDSLGIKSSPTTSGDVRVLAENKLLKSFLTGNEYMGNTNVGGSKRAEALKKIEKEYGVSVDNVVFIQDTSGKLKAVLDHDTTVKLTKEYGYTSFRHSLSDVDNAVPNMVTGKNPGLLSTYHRWGHGVDGEGMSSTTDMSYGSGDYIYITATSGSSDSNDGIFIHPEAIISRLDLWANLSDNYGKKGNGSSAPHDLLKNHNHIHEILPKDSVPLKDIKFIRVSGAHTVNKIIQQLKEKGITSINGKPLDQFIIQTGAPTPSYTPWQGATGINSAVAEQAIADVLADLDKKNK